MATPAMPRAASPLPSGPDDSPALHAADTFAAGDGLCDPQAVEVLVGEGPRYVRELMDWGAAFDRDADGNLALAMEGAHSARRVLHAHDATGREIGRVLWRRASALPGVRTSDHARAVSLIVDAKIGRCVGARVLHEDGGTSVVRAKSRPAGNRRRRTCLQRHDEPARGHRRRRGDGVSRGGEGRRSRVHPVPPDGLEDRGTAAIPAVGGAARRRCAAAQRGGRALHGALRSGRRSRAKRSRGAQHRARVAAHRRARSICRSRHSTRPSCTSGSR